MGPDRPSCLFPVHLGTGKTDFEHQIPWFSQRYRVIAPDPRGYGESRPPERDYPLGFYQRDAEDMLDLMTALGHEEFTVFGWSDGANIGALMAAQSPHRIRRLVVWGGNSYLSAEEITAFRADALGLNLVATGRRGNAANLRRTVRRLMGALCAWDWKTCMRLVGNSIDPS